MKNRHRYGAPLLGLLLVAILGAGCGTNTPTRSAHNVSAVVTTTIAPTTTAPAPTTTTAPPPPVTTTTAPPPRVVIVQVPATTVPTTIPPPPPCAGGSILLSGGPDLGGTLPGATSLLYVVGEVYQYAVNGVTLAVVGSCTYVAPSASDLGGNKPCPDGGVLMFVGDGYGPARGYPALWGLYFTSTLTECAYVGP